MKNEWTLEKIKGEFERFREENGRIPTVPEIDRLSYLPSSRTLQRKFGGLENLRKLLGYKDIHFGKGIHRSKIASEANLLGRNTELSLEKILRDRFGEVFIHAEKIFDDSKNRVDFYVYSPSGNFGIDVFYTGTMHDLQNNVNIKINKYKNFSGDLFFVVANEKFQQEDLDSYVLSKTKLLPRNTKIFTLKKLLEYIEDKKSYPNPLK